MGVPSLYKWLTQKYPEIKKRIDSMPPGFVDNLYLDFNAIIHPCCNKELSSIDATDKELYTNLINYLDVVMKKIKPKKLLYISIDGVAPRAKLNQQRARRFVKAKENMDAGQTYLKDVICNEETKIVMDKEHNVIETSKTTVVKEEFRRKESIDDIFGKQSNEKEKNAGNERIFFENDDAESDNKRQVFDVNAITPGTTFMDRLDLFLKELIQFKLSTDPLWTNLTVIYSNYMVP
ncbi:5'-3' exoribonuclease 2, partial [Enteropsectra breve]